MKWWKKAVVSLIIVFTVMQFIRPESNLQEKKAISINMPEDVSRIFSRSCFDCHSNNTRYPWYSSIQPFGWILARHIKKGKEDLNFDEFSGYSKRRQVNKLRAIKTSMKEGSMPLPSYLIIHRDARLSVEEMRLITQWTERMSDSIASRKI